MADEEYTPESIHRYLYPAERSCGQGHSSGRAEKEHSRLERLWYSAILRMVRGIAILFGVCNKLRFVDCAASLTCKL